MQPSVVQRWDEVAQALACPVCGGGLSRLERTFGCPAGHRFDLAKQGHLNLLNRAAPANADTADMIAARDRFLAAGHYQPITAALAAAVPPDAARVLEVGAGTGHHLAGVLDALPSARGIASDVSPAAARRAARAHDRAVSLVADTWQRLPLTDGSIDAVLCVFAPRRASEFARVLSPTGRVVIVTPLPAHLHQLREHLGLLDIHPDKQRQLEAQFADFTLLRREPIEFSLDLDDSAVADLVAMGPNAFHGHQSRGEPSSTTTQNGQARVDVAVEIRVLAAAQS